MAQPFRTLTTASMLAESKNQKYPESPVSGMPLPWPDEPSGFSQSAVTLKRPVVQAEGLRCRERTDRSPRPAGR